MTIKDFGNELKQRLNPYTGNDGLGFNYEKMCKIIDEILYREEYKEKIINILAAADENEIYLYDCAVVAKEYGSEAVEWLRELLTENDDLKIAEILGMSDKVK